MTTTTPHKNTSGNTTTTSHTTATHYSGHTADTYESAYFYQPGPYLEALKDRVAHILNITSEGKSGTRRRLLDIGGGTGNFTRRLIDGSDGLWEAVIVDPFLEANTTEKEEDRIQFISAAAEVFATRPHVNNDSNKDDSTPPPLLKDWEGSYDAILLKEVVHHLDDRVAIFHGLHRALKNANNSQTAQVLLVTRPQTDIDYPLWPAAQKVWADHQPSEVLLCEELRQAGFGRVEIHRHITQCAISLFQWQKMIKERCWSTFGHFSDEELRQACDQYLIQAPQLDLKDKTLRFEDRLLLLAAYR